MADQPTVVLKDAINIVRDEILNSPYSNGLALRNKERLSDMIKVALSTAATVPARDEKGHFIADDPSTPEDESRAKPKSKS